MECEVRKESQGSKGATLLCVLEEQVKLATDKLLLTDFSACLEMCRHVASAASGVDDADTETTQRAGQVREAATVLGIQALAEQGAWKDVIPFVQQIYTHMAACPAAIMQMCLLLHAQVREFLVCHSLVRSWLDWEDHASHPDSTAIVHIYVTQVLGPLGAFNLIPQVVERCSALSSEERQNLLSPRTYSPKPAAPFKTHAGHTLAYQKIEEDAAEEAAEKPNAGENVKEVESDKPPSGFRIVTLYLEVARRLWRKFAKKGWCRQIKKASKFFFLLSFVLLALMHVQTDVTSNFSRAMEVWKKAFGTLSSLLTRRTAKPKRS